MKVAILLTSLGIIFASQVSAADAFLGISVRQPTPTLRHHLELGPNDGLVVASVRPGGPAAKAGLQVHNVILEIAGVAVGTEEQLIAALTKLKPKDTAALWVIQEGKHEVVEVIMGTPPTGTQTASRQSNFDNQPFKILMNLEPITLNAGGNGVHSAQTVMLHDGTHSINAKKINGKLTVVVRDNGGKTLFEGPVNTGEDAKKLPPGVRQKLEGNGILPTELPTAAKPD